MRERPRWMRVLVCESTIAVNEERWAGLSGGRTVGAAEETLEAGYQAEGDVPFKASLQAEKLLEGGIAGAR